jgi:hypothetical protein
VQNDTNLGCWLAANLQKTCSNWDMGRPGPRPFPCPAGHVFLGANEFYSPPSKEVCCSVSGWWMQCCAMAVQLSSACSECAFMLPGHALPYTGGDLLCTDALPGHHSAKCMQLPPSAFHCTCCRVRRLCRAHVLMPTVLSLEHSHTPALLAVCWTQAARPSRTYQTTCAAWCVGWRCCARSMCMAQAEALGVLHIVLG